MTEFVFQGLLGASFSLCAIYLLLALYTFKKLLWLHSNSTEGLNTRKLFVMTCLLTSVLRFMSFGSMAVLDLNSIHFRLHSAGEVDDDMGNSTTKQFFEKSLLVLFDFPDFCCISAYVLLIVVWAEAYLKSRRHWLSSYSFRKNWMLGYFVFNVLLYSTQVALYSLLFIPEIDQTVQTNLIYLTLATFNVLLPCFWCSVYIYLTIKFSGFPYSTPDAKLRLGTLNWLGLVWSLGRLMWGIVALTSVLNGWLTEAQKSKEYYTAFLVVLFMMSEVIPILFSLKKTVIQRLGEKNFTTNSVAVSQDASTTGYGPAVSMFNAANNSSANKPNSMREPLLTPGALSGHSVQSIGSTYSLTTTSKPTSNPSTFSMMFAGRGSGSKDYVCIESPITSDDFQHLYGSSHHHSANAKSAAGSSADIPISSSHSSSVNLADQYHGKESFDDNYIAHMRGQRTSAEEDRLHSADRSDRNSYATAQSGRSPANNWATWLGF